MIWARTVRTIICLLMLTIGVSPVLGATLSPEQTVTEIITKLKATGDPVVVTDYVHWETAYQKMDPNLRKSQKIDSPQKLREYYRRALGDTPRFLRDMVEAHSGALSEEKRRGFDEKVDKVAALVQQGVLQMKNDLVRTTFTVGQSNIDGNNATVELVSERDEKKRNDTIRLTKVGDRWLLTSVQLVR